MISIDSRGAPGPSNPGLFSKIKRVLGIDRAIAFTVLARGWSSTAGLVTLGLIARNLNPIEQGFYYTFYSLVAIQLVFELGFSTVILQVASHECAHLSVPRHGPIHGNPVHLSRLASVLQKTTRWYALAAILMFICVVPGGVYFFRQQSSSSAIAWFWPWVCVVLASSCTFQIDPLFSFLEGCGFVHQVARTRFVQALIGSLLGWVVLAKHLGLFAPAAIISGQFLVGSVWLYFKRDLLLPLLRAKPGENRINWIREVWPFQWRIAVSWICGYFIFQLFTPVLFASWGPVEAGRMGMSLSLCGALSAVSVAWMNTKAAPFGKLIALKQYIELDRLFFRAMVQSTGISILLGGVLWMMIPPLASHQIRFATRVLPPLPFAFLLLATICNVIVNGEAIYLRAHKIEKFMGNSILGAVAIGSCTWVFGRKFGAFGVTSGYLICSVVIGIGFGTWIFLKNRRLLHES